MSQVSRWLRCSSGGGKRFCTSCGKILWENEFDFSSCQEKQKSNTSMKIVNFMVNTTSLIFLGFIGFIMAGFIYSMLEVLFK